MDRRGYLTVRDVVDYNYCPRSIYFHYCLKAGKEKTPKMEMGKERHKTFSSKKRAKMVKDLPSLPREYNRTLYSEEYGMNARVDCILLKGKEAYPVEFKASPKPGVLYNTHKYQAVAQALAVEEALGKEVPYAYLKYANGEVVELAITPRLKEKLVAMIEEIGKIVEHERLPRPTDSRKKCRGCFYSNLCRRL